MAKNLKVGSVTIPSGTDSSGLTLENSRIPLALEMPATFTGTSLTFKSASSSGGTYFPLYYEGTLYSVNVGTSRHIALDRRAFEGVRYLQIISGSSEGSARVITVITGE